MAAALVVDDDPVSRRVVTHLLQRLGHTPMVAADGPSALALLGSFQPAVACVDLQMPGMSGIELVARMRDALGARAPWIVMLTASGDARDRVRAGRVGIDRYLTKPVSSTAMAEVMQSLLGGTTDPSGAVADPSGHRR